MTGRGHECTKHIYLTYETHCGGESVFITLVWEMLRFAFSDPPRFILFKVPIVYKYLCYFGGHLSWNIFYYIHSCIRVLADLFSLFCVPVSANGYFCNLSSHQRTIMLTALYVRPNSSRICKDLCYIAYFCGVKCLETAIIIGTL